MWIFLTSSVYGQKPDYPATLYFVLCMFFSPQNYYFRPPLQLPPYRQLLSSPIYSSLILHWKHTPKAVRQEFPCFTFSKNVSHLHLCPQFLPSLLLASVSVLGTGACENPTSTFLLWFYHFSLLKIFLPSAKLLLPVAHSPSWRREYTNHYVLYIFYKPPSNLHPPLFPTSVSLPLFIAKLLEKNCL